MLGCGWLGLPLAEELLSAGYAVKGSSTRSEQLEVLRKTGIEPYRIELKADGIHGPITEFLKGLDCLVCNIPPGLRKDPNADYPGRIRQLVAPIRASGLSHLIFVSSTSVFGSDQGEVDEATTPIPDSLSGRQVLEAEEVLRHAVWEVDVTVVRFGGLIGGNRHPVRQLSGKKGISGGGDPVNLIRREDCLRILVEVIRSDPGEALIHGVAPEHPAKREYYVREAVTYGLPAPEFRPESAENPSKLIKSRSFLIKKTGFKTSIFS